EELVSWAASRRPRAERTLRLVLGLRRHFSGEIMVEYQARVSGARMRDEPRSLTQLAQLRGLMRRTPGMFSDEQAALLEMLTDEQTVTESSAGPVLNVSGLVRLLERFSDSTCLAWSESLDPELAQLGGIQPGGPVRLRGEPVRILPTATREDGQVRIELAFHWPDGRERSHERLIHIAAHLDREIGPHRGVVLAEGAFWIVAEQPPREVMGLFADVGGLPVGP